MLAMKEKKSKKRNSSKSEASTFNKIKQKKYILTVVCMEYHVLQCLLIQIENCVSVYENH